MAKVEFSRPRRVRGLMPMSGEESLSIAERHDFLANGELVWSSLRRFCVYRRFDRLLCCDWLDPGSAFVVPTAAVSFANRRALPEPLFARFLPPVIDTAPIVIKDRPQHDVDDHFWQYPCATERQAYENHSDMTVGSNLDVGARIIHTYLGLPWATYIDRKRFPREIFPWLRPRIMGWRRMAVEHGYALAVHTVCQQIYWRRLVGRIRDLGVTDLHLSHCERKSDQERCARGLRIWSWPLMAVNVEDPTRSMGLEHGKPIARRRYLASFIGAYLPHYRSDARLRLLEAARRDGGDDLLVEVGDEWHFEKTVYQEQVGNRQIAAEDRARQATATRRYNEILSNSVFSLCPEGAGPNTLRIWESLAVGAIPVILAEDWRPPEVLRSASDAAACCLFIQASQISDIFNDLRNISHERIRSMSAACLKVYAETRALRTYATDAASGLANTVGGGQIGTLRR